MHHVSVDSARCQGHARCLAFAPEVFEFDDEGYSYVPEDRKTVEGVSVALGMALANCPERAIQLNEVAGE